MDKIIDFFLDELKEKHIVNNIFKFYYQDWDELKFKKLKKKIMYLNGSSYVYSRMKKLPSNIPQYELYRIRKIYTKEYEELKIKLEKELFQLQYFNMRKYDSINEELFMVKRDL